ncbi:hypothetical protein [Brevibacterium sp.]|uniref:hypothetical protein n=1 Tax=Brevibacterium sp. TaxID=1701 RepID=UPI00281151CA|nr:hypothetical protein [Brevibacterium sp.]
MDSMYNVVATRELNAAGVPSPIIRQALGCCLLKLSYGVYTVVRMCADPRHTRLRQFATDAEWLRINEEHRARENAFDFEYAALLYKLKASSYPHYNADDVLFGLTAAVLHDLPLFRPALNHIFVAHPTSHSSGPLVKRRVQRIDESDVVTVGKMRVTTSTRASLELIAQIGETAAYPAIEHVVRLLVFSSAEAADRAARRGYPSDIADRTRAVIERSMRPVALRLRKGQQRALQLLDSADSRSESYAESRCALNLRMLRIVGFEPQVDVFEGSRWIARVDFMHRETGTILFIDGTTKYVHNGFALMRKEAAQHNALTSLDYRVLRFGFDDTIDLERFATILFNQAPELRRHIGR